MHGCMFPVPQAAMPLYRRPAHSQAHRPLHWVSAAADVGLRVLILIVLWNAVLTYRL